MNILTKSHRSFELVNRARHTAARLVNSDSSVKFLQWNGTRTRTGRPLSASISASSSSVYRFPSMFWIEVMPFAAQYASPRFRISRSPARCASVTLSGSRPVAMPSPSRQPVADSALTGCIASASRSSPLASPSGPMTISLPMGSARPSRMPPATSAAVLHHAV